MFSLLGRRHGLAFWQKNRRLERPGDLSVQRHFLALVPGQRAAHGGRQLREGLDQGVPDQVGGVPPVG